MAARAYRDAQRVYSIELLKAERMESQARAQSRLSNLGDKCDVLPFVQPDIQFPQQSKLKAI